MSGPETFMMAFAISGIVFLLWALAGRMREFEERLVNIEKLLGIKK